MPASSMSASSMSGGTHYAGSTQNGLSANSSTLTAQHRLARQQQRKLIWRCHDALKAYCRDPDPKHRVVLRARFERIFRRRTGFVTLNRLLARLHANKTELLMVLDRLRIPLHTNRSVNDIRYQVTKHWVNGGSRSDIGRDCRNTFLSLVKTCNKLDVSFQGRSRRQIAHRRNPARAIPSPNRPPTLPK